MIKIDQQVILATKQIISFDEYRLSKDHEGKLQSEIRFLVRGESGQLIRPISFRLTGEEHNTFWNAFNTGGDLYKLLATREGMTFTADADTEKEFVN